MGNLLTFLLLISENTDFCLLSDFDFNNTSNCQRHTTLVMRENCWDFVSFLQVKILFFFSIEKKNLNKNELGVVWSEKSYISFDEKKCFCESLRGLKFIFYSTKLFQYWNSSMRFTIIILLHSSGITKITEKKR